MSYFGNIQEEELKSKVGEVFFDNFDHTIILGQNEAYIMGSVR